MTALRNTLPQRRQSITEKVVITRSDGNATSYQVTIGFDEARQPKEVFLNNGKSGTDMAMLLADAAVSLSVALQCGVTAKQMAHSVLRLPLDLEGDNTAPGSIIGAVLDMLTDYEC